MRPPANLSCGAYNIDEYDNQFLVNSLSSPLNNKSKSNINNVEVLKGDVMLSDEYKNAQVVTSDGKNIGNVKSSDSKSLVVFKKGFLRDEEFHVDIAAISHYDRGSVREDNNSIAHIILNLNEEEVRHGFEFGSKNKPNSDFISGKSDSAYKVGLEKESVRYEAFKPDFEKNVNPASSTDKLPSEQEYICEMCMQKFYHSNELQDHRKDLHSAATGI
jgi:hypothetical protein